MLTVSTFVAPGTLSSYQIIVSLGGGAETETFFLVLA